MWQLQTAKNKFSQVVAEALQGGPQIITRHGVEVVVLLSYQDYKKLVGASNQAKKKLSQFFRESPLLKAELDFSRDPSDARATLEL
ncbi:MAG: type II toxin-antitoxin system Phd/YefM family antitoxin [Caldilineaceae bacterium]